MKCPFCGYLEDKVVDSRESREGEAIRRRRECLRCERRFTSYERIDEIPYMVVKKDGRRETFDRNKVMAGLLRACEKRPVPSSKLDSIVNAIEKYVQESSERERPTSKIGEMIMRRLKELDKVAYVRFASVYLEFEDVSEFMTELKHLVRTRASGPAGKKVSRSNQGDSAMIKPIRATGLERLELQRLRDRVGDCLLRCRKRLKPRIRWLQEPGRRQSIFVRRKTRSVVRVELPGVTADQIKIGLMQHQAAESGARRNDDQPRDRIISHLCSERSYGKFSRIVPLRWTVSVRDATAELENGILHIRLPKIEDRRGGEFIVRS